VCKKVRKRAGTAVLLIPAVIRGRVTPPLFLVRVFAGVHGLVDVFAHLFVFDVAI
jgi:hypothetical protein